MTILYEYTVGSKPLLWASIILWTLAAVLFITATILIFTNKEISYAFVYILVIIAIIVGCISNTDTRCSMIKATIDDTTPYTEVCKHYEYVSREGDIWTLKYLKRKKNKMTNFKCICGGTAYFNTILKDGYITNQIYCPKCGLMMFSREYDEDGIELKRRWQEVMGKKDDEHTLPFSALTHPNMEALDKRDKFLEGITIRIENGEIISI